MAQPIATRCQQGFSPRPTTSEDDLPDELDEPPDELIHFTRISPLKPSSIPTGQCTMPSLAQHDKKASLLTQALLTSDDSTPNSDAEAPLLTSDADLSSPARTNSPSPPPPASRPSGLSTIPSHDIAGSDAQTSSKHVKLPPATEITNSSPATDLEAGLGRKRCIKFACGRQDTARPEGLQAAKPPTPNDSDAKATNSTRRPCMLRFVCPMRASSRSTKDRQSSVKFPNGDSPERSSSVIRQNSIPDSQTRQHRDSVSTIKAVPVTTQGLPSDVYSALKPPLPNNPDMENSEATRFHEFAGPYSKEDEWIHEQLVYHKKITVNDTLRKENAIRKLGEEAEEEALEEEEEEDDAEERDEGSYAELDDVNDDLSSDDNVSDAGNETDDEEGFAESDNESELGSDYQFWTPGLTTAATSADHLEHIRPNAPRTASESSIESMIRVKDAFDVTGPTGRRVRKAHRTRPAKMRPGTPDLPDSTDFVCGTLDEDRPLEAAYMSCLEERRRSKRCVIPQDIDPSFPTSEPEDDKDGETSGGSKQASDELLWVMGQPDHSDEERINARRRPLTRQKTKSPMPSPKRLRSPPPQKRSVIHRSPPPPMAHRPTPSDSNPSMPSSSSEHKRRPLAQKMTPARLPQRPQLTHTASLPRTPNPFWAPRGVGYPASSAAASPNSRAPDGCSRGPIDIVTGLEKKRQRRKEKYWRQHGRNGGKEKERRCQPGKGAERMRELGLEMAGKNKGYLPNAQLMLSI
ncbi:MAG: hypothetical protein L6R42_000395 [Xanthoria sp. 1 TBL-2021]|nr:MAG: hypothetical protein L6R42_000395 [Xanthoria sp. 1 TBL-2021]